jgi:D-glycero-alpha-D-manno-heptose-7-phosphate kinase
MLLFVAPEQQAAVRAALHDLIYVPFQFENSGSHVIYYQP